jgi:thioredoxin-related protein
MTALLVALLPITALAADTASFFSLNMGDLKTEVAEAKSEGKKALLLVFEQEGCPYCRFMREKVMSRKEVQDFYRANFVALPVDIWSAVPIRDFAGREQTEKDFSRAGKVKVTPTFVFYDLSGSEIARFAGSTDTPEEFLLLGDFVASGAYKTRTFAQFKAGKPARKGG